jgi:hypothetical protein
MISIGIDSRSIRRTLSLSCVAREVRRVSSEGVHLYSYYPELFLNNPNVATSNYYGHCRVLELPEAVVEHSNYYYCRDIGVEAVDIHPELYLGKDELSQARVIYDLPTKYIVICADLWYNDRWEEVVRAMKVPVLQLRGPADTYVNGCIDIVGTTLRKSCSIIAQAQLVICGVGDYMEIAAATNTPAVILYGGAEPTYTGYPTRHLLVSTSIECAPCSNPVDCNRDMVCMERIKPGHIISSVEKIGRGITGVISL